MSKIHTVAYGPSLSPALDVVSVSMLFEDDTQHMHHYLAVFTTHNCGMPSVLRCSCGYIFEPRDVVRNFLWRFVHFVQEIERRGHPVLRGVLLPCQLDPLCADQVRLNFPEGDEL